MSTREIRKILSLLEQIEYVWTLETAEKFVHSITRLAADNGFKIDIVGGVKQRGYSKHDLDLAITSIDFDEEGDEEMFISRLKDLYEVIKAPSSSLGMGISHYILTMGNDDKEVDLFID